MSVYEKMTAIADAIREKTGTADKLGLDAMAEGIGAVHEAGQQAEYDRFWDSFQQNGNRTNYYYTFAGKGWTDDTFNPKYPIVASSGSSAGMGMFYDCSGITRIPVPIEVASGVSIQAMFSACSKLQTITLLKLGGNNNITSNSFNGLYALENITFDGYIEKSVTFPQSGKLTDASVQNIIDHLADLTGKTAQTLTFYATVGEKLTEEQKAAITAKNWTLVY